MEWKQYGLMCMKRIFQQYGYMKAVDFHTAELLI